MIEKRYEKKIWRNLIIVLTITLVLAFILGKYWQGGNTFFDESMVAAGAFILLIYATFLQLIELRYQRRDLNLTKEEMRAQTKEFEQVNNLSIQGMKQTQFFELLLLKENYYKDFYVEERETFKLNFYKELHRILIREFMDNITENAKRKFVEDNHFITNEFDDYKNKTMEEKIKDMMERNATHDDFRTYYSNDEAIIDNMFASALGESHYIHTGIALERIDSKIMKPYLIHRNILELFNRSDNEALEYLEILYNAQIEKAERDLYDILEKKLNIDQFYEESANYGFKTS